MNSEFQPAPTSSRARKDVDPAVDRYPFDFRISPQPTDTSCGPTCLSAIYHFYKDPVSVEQLIKEIPSVEGGGTLAVALGIHALRRQYRATLYTSNLRIFDPTWFNPQIPDFRERLAAQISIRKKNKERSAARFYLEFFDLGGKLLMKDLSGKLIRHHLKRGNPILTGLSATILYMNSREIPETCQDDDLRGEPVGHFVVLCGYDKESQEVKLADPMWPNPYKGQIYSVKMNRLLNSILLGVLTYDSNLLIIEPPSKPLDR